MENWYINIKWKMQELKHLFNGKKQHRKIDYKDYELSLEEQIRCVAEGIAIILLFSYFFYRSWLAVILLLPLLHFYKKEKGRTIGKRKQEIMELQFKEVILSVWTGLQAGYSMENAFVGSIEDAIRLYGKEGAITGELTAIKAGMKNGMSLEEMLTDLGLRCGGEVERFSNVYSIAAKTGGKWNEVFGKTVDIITRKIEIKQEIEVLIHEKQMESKIMCAIPFFILFYMDITSKGYFGVLYHNPLGVIIMTMCMFLYIYAIQLSRKITEL